MHCIWEGNGVDNNRVIIIEKPKIIEYTRTTACFNLSYIKKKPLAVHVPCSGTISVLLYLTGSLSGCVSVYVQANRTDVSGGA